MNRQQAEHILDAYVRIRMNEADKDASDALRAVILDAMTDYKSNGITMSSPWKVETVPCSHPTAGHDTPMVTFTGIDPMFGHTTSASTVYANGHTQEVLNDDK